ncbi:hypothetical protein [Nostoc sphaeroides]|uniref:Uncharacterized protein n=1 Tax=Nostoc sphaeroides CCNUC1 TaxID=2653204 RepID=A0A5P8VZX3_9NOSO|nr:hypothetical protein [Nostoc sphaeroides]MCC5630194.1 hypothetical protein [Nostoc sphaeroides CHAB 2801]QFS45998.1 hypothetical protein GXM_03478 [Nostoc sphaeroides CCNUC1]
MSDLENFTPKLTADASFTFVSQEFGESFHSSLPPIGEKGGYWEQKAEILWELVVCPINFAGL